MNGGWEVRAEGTWEGGEDAEGNRGADNWFGLWHGGDAAFSGSRGIEPEKPERKES